MSATPRTLHTIVRSLMLGTLSVGLVLGLGLTGTSTTTTAQAAPASDIRLVSDHTDSAKTVQARKAAKATKRIQARKAAKATKRIQARKAARATKRIQARKARVRARRAVLSKVGRAKGIALAQRGDRYVYGATGPNAFDCSGLVQFAYKRAGFPRMPRTSGAQAGHTRRIAKGAMRPGDLMFFANGGRVYHVGIFIGRGRGGVPLMVHSSRPGTPVGVSVPWTSSWFAGTVRAA
ncbi:C40 family peptidase [Nocardioides houyundeii]|uniref:C40 family peptidase n=1 Tax=Nocardioides houyundeii TaxID=2045452 RepID=UPI0018F03B10|nr:NlpC/P60 family protein [Nocardioides houyundeii]